MSNPPIGYRQNNPLNIVYDANTPWQGRLDGSAGGRFEWFQSFAWGYRAAARILISYQDRHDIHTIDGIIRRWAPPNENDTDKYISYVVERSGHGEHEKLDLHDGPTLDRLMRAMAEVELGRTWAAKTFHAIPEGLKLAGAQMPKPPAAIDPRILAPAGIGAAGVVEAVEVIRPLMSTGVLDWVADKGLKAGLVMIVLVAALWLIQRAMAQRGAEV